MRMLTVMSIFHGALTYCIYVRIGLVFSAPDLTAANQVENETVVDELKRMYRVASDW